ncbi:MAG: hypothetical protein V1809_05790 [Planctomycetota bacterium]
MKEYLSGHVRYGWGWPDCDLREIKKKDSSTWSNNQRMTWSHAKFLIERIEFGHRVVVQTEQPIRRFVVAEVIAPGYNFEPGNLDDFNHLLNTRPLTPEPIPINSKAITAALRHDLSKRGNYYEIYPEESIRELDDIVVKAATNKLDLTAVRTDADTFDHTLRDTRRHIILEISRKWPGKDFERFCEKLLPEIEFIEVKEHVDCGKGWDLLVRIINPLTRTILLDDVPVQCKNYSGKVDSLAPIDDLERCIRNSDSPVAYLIILGQLTPRFLNELQIRQETLRRILNRPVSLELITEDRVAEIYGKHILRAMSES